MNSLLNKFNKIKRKPTAYKKLMKRKRITKKVVKSVAKRRAKETRLKSNIRLY